MNYRSTLLAAGAAVALSGLASAQLNYSHHWNSLRSGPPTVIFDPNFFDVNGTGASVGIGDSIRFCYSIDITQGGRNESNGAWEITWSYYSQAFGGNNAILGVDLGPQIYHSQVSDDLGDDSCFSAFFAQTGTMYQQPGGFILPGLIAGTGGFSLNQGFYWNIAFQFLSPLPQGANTLGLDPLVGPTFGTPLLAHFMFEVQGPVNSGTFNKQYFLGSTSERPGLSPAGSGGVTNGNNSMGINLFGVPAEVSGAVAGARFTAFDEFGGLLTGGTVALATPGDIEFFGGVAFSTPNLRGNNGNNTGNGNADWTISAPPFSAIDIEILDRFSGGQAPGSGSSIENPFLAVNNGFVLLSATPAVSMLQNPMSWDDLGGVVPPKLGSYVLPAQSTTRFTDNEQMGLGGGVPLGLQNICINFDASSAQFLNFGISLLSAFNGALDPTLDASTASLFDYGVGPGLEGSSNLGSITPGTAAPGAAGLKLGIHGLVLQLDVTQGALLVAETTNAKTAVLQ